jgi:HK97 family phage prohead protease
MKNLNFKNFEIKSVVEDNNEMFIEGYGAVFGNVDGGNDIIDKGAFTKTISENRDRIAFCYQHDIYNPIGKIDEISEDEYGLKIRVRVSDSEDDIKTKIRENILKEMSIGYSTIKSDYNSETDIRHLKELKLWEVSLVTLAMNPLAVITSMKADEQKTFLESEFDRVIAIETNKNKKFDLLKLKSLILSLPQEQAQEVKEPIKKEEVKSIFSNFTYE